MPEELLWEVFNQLKGISYRQQISLLGTLIVNCEWDFDSWLSRVCNNLLVENLSSKPCHLTKRKWFLNFNIRILRRAIVLKKFYRNAFILTYKHYRNVANQNKLMF